MRIIPQAVPWIVGAALVGWAGAAQSTTCDVGAPRFDPLHATPGSSHPKRTRIPREIGVELSGFATRADAARCFGARYHKNRRAEHVTAIVRIGPGWGYLTPGKGGRNASTVEVASLLRAYRNAGYRLYALAHTHPYGLPRFSHDDVLALLKHDGGELYLTNWRNETFRITPALLEAHLPSNGRRADRRRLTQSGGFAGEAVF